MSLLHLLEDKHFGRLDPDKVIKLARKDASFCNQWLVHVIRSQCTSFELALALAFADKWQLALLPTLEGYLDNIFPDNNSNSLIFDDALEKVQSIISDVSITRIQGLLQKLTWDHKQQNATQQLSQFITLTDFNIEKIILDKVISATLPKLQDVTLFGDQGRSSKDESIRNNSHYPTPLPNNLLELAIIERIMSVSAKMPIQFAEPPVILRYKPGQYYKWHYDHIYAHTPVIQQQIDQFGQRVKTAIFYLNDSYEGGNTEFKQPSFSVTPKKGRVLAFDNTADNQNRLTESLHRGVELVSGEKWIITLWFRDKPFWLRSGLL